MFTKSRVGLILLISVLCQSFALGGDMGCNEQHEMLNSLEKKYDAFITAYKQKTSGSESFRDELEYFYENIFSPKIGEIENCIIAQKDTDLFEHVIITFIKTSSIAAEDLFMLITGIIKKEPSITSKTYSNLSKENIDKLEGLGIKK